MGKTTFTRDERNATLLIERTFDAARGRVWQALTDPQILDQWWAPRPWKTETVRMDFRIGGYWHYAMKGPQGERHFGRMDYTQIVPQERFASSDVFCDAEGNADESLPRQRMEIVLVAVADATKVVTTVRYASLEDMNTILAMGMQEGLTMAQDQLEALLAQQEPV